MRQVTCVVGLATALLVGAGAALGAPATIRFAGPASCPTADAARARLERALTDALGKPPPATFEASITVRADGDELVLSAEITAGEIRGTRALRGKSCDELLEAVALVLVMTLEALTEEPADSGGGGPGEENRLDSDFRGTPGDGESPPAIVLGAGAPPPEEGGSRAPATRRIGIELGLSGGGKLGIATHPSPALAAQLQITDGPFAAELIASYLPESTATLAADATRGATLRYAEATVRLCRQLRPVGRLRLSGCLGLAGSLLLWTGFGFAGPAEPATAAGFAGELGAVLGLPLFGPLSARLDVRMGLALARSRAVFLDEGAAGGPTRVPIHSTELVTGSVALGLMLRLR